VYAPHSDSVTKSIDLGGLLQSEALSSPRPHNSFTAFSQVWGILLMTGEQTPRLHVRTFLTNGDRPSQT